MVKAIRGFVKAALKCCWIALLRSVSPAVQAVAVNPVTSPEVALGPDSRFRLASVVTSTPVDLANSSGEIRQLLEHRRSAFSEGEFFRPFEHVGRSGAVIVAHISERGFVNAEHFLAVYPSPGNRSRQPKIRGQQMGDV